MTGPDGFPGVERNLLTDGFFEFGIPLDVDLVLMGTDAADFLRTGIGSDRFSGGAGDDQFHGGAGNDTFVGGSGNDVFHAGAGSNDTLSYEGADGSPNGAGISATVSVGNPVAGQPATSVSVVDGWGDTDTGTSVEAIIGTSGDDRLSLDGKFTQLRDAFGGMDGGAGSDTVDLSETTFSDGLHVNLTEGTISDISVFDPNHSIDILNFENVIGTAQSDTITGDDKNNIIDGGGDADTIDGGGGQDTILFDNLDASVQGGAGYDVGLAVGETAPDLTDGLHRSDANSSEGVALAGHDHGIEVVLGGSGNDTLTVAHSTETHDKQITLTLDAHHWSEDKAGDDGRDFFNPVSNVGDKRILDLSGVNIVDGGQGNDILIGYSGEILDAGAPPSMLMGGMGDDTYHLSLPASNEEYDPGLQQIYDQDGVGRIYVGGVEISNLTLGGWDRGFDGQGDGDFLLVVQ